MNNVGCLRKSTNIPSNMIEYRNDIDTPLDHVTIWCFMVLYGAYRRL